MKNNGIFEDKLARKTWFEKGKSIDYIKAYIQEAKNTIRIATGFFTIRGWNLIRNYTSNKKTLILVGIDEPGEEKARLALINEIMRDLRTGLDQDRRKSVSDLVLKIQSKKFEIVDARARDHHNKLYIFDEGYAIQTSSNLTGKGLIDQVEGGNIIDNQEEVNNLIIEFDEYFQNAYDLTKDLLEILLKWLNFCSPWEIYLRTLLALETIKPVRTTYSKKPFAYQQDMISLTISQIHRFGGSMLVASTGLGKTVIGTWVAIHLCKQDLIDKILVICPNAVKNSWRKEMRNAGLSAEYLTVETLDKQNAHDLIFWDESVRDIETNNGRYLLIFDESHKLRKRYPDNFSNKYRDDKKRRERKAFTRINHMVNKIGQKDNIKVLLLTGSPYATDIENINVQLHLLPHTSESNNYLLPDFFDDSRAWKIEDSKRFIELPVAHQLTTPHVAKYYAELDENGRYIQFGNERKYFPDVLLFTISIGLLFEKELSPLIIQGLFDLNISNPTYRKNIVTKIKVAWASSPEALKDCLQSVVDTPGGKKSYNLEKSEFIYSLEDRKNALIPIIDKLENLGYSEDKKLQQLLEIIDFHWPSEKIVIFCERFYTAYYLQTAINQLRPDINLFCTIEKATDNRCKPKTLKIVEKAIEEFAPIANNISEGCSKTYEVFITTDNYGIGVNMQDAAVVVNYDIAWTPIEPIQRAGRILRLWDTFRTVKIYTFIPNFTKINEFHQESIKISKRWQNLMERHQESRTITDLPVITDSSEQLIHMPNFAPDVEIEKGKLTFDYADDSDISIFYKHMKDLHIHRDLANKLTDDLISALTYDGDHAILYLLLEVDNRYETVVYNVNEKRIMFYSLEKLLDLIKCEHNTETAFIDANLIEDLADIALRQWCQKNNVQESDISRICTLFLQPSSQETSIQNLFDN